MPGCVTSDLWDWLNLWDRNQLAQVVALCLVSTIKKSVPSKWWLIAADIKDLFAMSASLLHHCSNISVSFCLSVCHSLLEALILGLPVSLFVCLPLSIYLSVTLFLCLCLFKCLSVSVFLRFTCGCDLALYIWFVLYFSDCLSSQLPLCLLSHLPAYLSACPPIFLFPGLSLCPSVFT